MTVSGKGVGGNREMGMSLLGAFLDVIKNTKNYEKLIDDDLAAANALASERLKISKTKDIDRLHKRAAELQEQASQERQAARGEAEKLIEDTKAELAKGMEALSEERETFSTYLSGETTRLRNWVTMQDERAELIAVKEKETVANLEVSREARAAGEKFRNEWQEKNHRLTEAMK